jgi:hypothetical protein
MNPGTNYEPTFETTVAQPVVVEIRHRLAIAFGAALLVAGLLLVTVILPAEFALDPLGTGAKLTSASLVRANLAAYFRVNEPDGTPNPLVDFGFNIKDAEGNPVGEIAWSDLFNVIRDTPGVRKMGDSRLDLTLNGLPADVRLNVREFPVLRTVTLTNGDTLTGRGRGGFGPRRQHWKAQRHLLVIGAYRDDEVDATHAPLSEDAGALPGEAEHWTLSAVTSLEEIAGFGAAPEEAWEDFERWFDLLDSIDDVVVVLAFFDSALKGYEEFESGWANVVYLYELPPAQLVTATFDGLAAEECETGWSNVPYAREWADVVAATGVFDGEPRENFEDQWRSNQLYASTLAAFTPVSCKASASMLVRTVTAMRLGRFKPKRAASAAVASEARRIISVPPAAWTLKRATPRRTASRAAAETVFGMSWNLRSRKTRAPSPTRRRTRSGPAVVKSCEPTLNMPAALRSSPKSLRASSALSTSRPCSRHTSTIESLMSIPRALTPRSASSARNSPRPQPISSTSLAPAKRST